MWDCPECGCKQIAHSLAFCPVCRKDRDMGKISRAGMTDRYAQPGEPGYTEPVLEDKPEDKPKVRKPKAAAETVELPADEPAGD